MTAWVKASDVKGRVQLWLRVDGDWKRASMKPGCFDNMDDRPITGSSDWTKYELVVDVPTTSTYIAFGMMLIGKGHAWLDDVSFRVVPNSVPLTGRYAKTAVDEAQNLDFEE